MKTKIHLFLSVVLSVFLMFFLSLKSYAFDYTITFTGTGASTSVESVIVQNLTKGTTVTVPAGNVLSLNDAPNAVEQLNADDETIRVYPNSVEGKSTVSFFAKQAGSTQLNAFSIDGRKIVGITENLQTGINAFQLSLPKGSYAIQVAGNGYTYTAKMINQTGTARKPEIAYIGTVKPATSAPQKSKSSALGTTTMTYATGDRLLYKAVSGNYSTIVTDVPTASKTINFVFAACTDADANNYKVVKIGTQTWMAENLKTTKYNDGTSIPNVTDDMAWGALKTPAYCWYNNDAATYKNTYGALYNWYTINTAKLAPTGWHVPTYAEWTTLENYLIANGYNYDGTTSGNKIAKSLAATTDWYSDTSPGTIGNDLTKNNSSGFSALPGGCRYSYGAFDHVGDDGYWWSSTEYYPTDASYRSLHYYYFSLERYYISMSWGLSVRCVKDTIPTDIDDNVYQTVTIGTQTWMASNLRVTHYRNGESITNLTVDTDWAGATFAAWCDYSNSAANGTKYGHLYNWYAVSDARNIAPAGWHVASDAEWTTLENYLIANGYNYDGTTTGKYKIAKSLAATTDWYTYFGTGTIGNDLTKNNSSGFTALPGGDRNCYDGTFRYFGGTGYWWSSTEYSGSTTKAWYRGLSYSYSGLVTGYDTKSYGFSVRCVRDYTAIGYTVAVSTNPSTLLNQPTGGGTFNSGASVTVTAVANIGYTFTNWTEGINVVSPLANYIFTIAGNRTLVANYTPVVVGQFIVALSSNPLVGGITTGGGTFNSGASVTVTAAANTGYTFVNWTEGGTIVPAAPAIYTFTISGNRTLVANFSW